MPARQIEKRENPPGTVHKPPRGFGTQTPSDKVVIESGYDTKTGFPEKLRLGLQRADHQSLAEVALYASRPAPSSDGAASQGPELILKFGDRLQIG